MVQAGIHRLRIESKAVGKELAKRSISNRSANQSSVLSDRLNRTVGQCEWPCGPVLLVEVKSHYIASPSVRYPHSPQWAWNAAARLLRKMPRRAAESKC